MSQRQTFVFIKLLICAELATNVSVNVDSAKIIFFHACRSFSDDSITDQTQLLERFFHQPVACLVSNPSPGIPELLLQSSFCRDVLQATFNTPCKLGEFPITYLIEKYPKTGKFGVLETEELLAFIEPVIKDSQNSHKDIRWSIKNVIKPSASKLIASLTLKRSDADPEKQKSPVKREFGFGEIDF